MHILHFWHKSIQSTVKQVNLVSNLISWILRKVQIREIKFAT